MTDNPYATHGTGERRYEIVEDRGSMCPYTVYRYYGDSVYPFGSVVHCAYTKWGARRIIKRDRKVSDRYVIDTVYG